MTIRNPNAPCKGCGDRTPECHGSCELYKEFSLKCQELREKRLKASLEAPYGYKMRMWLFGWNKDKR